MNKRAFLLSATVAAVFISTSSMAAVYDLSSSGSNAVSVTGGTGGTAQFSTFFDQPAGTGYIRPFLRTELQGQPKSWCNGTRCEQGYNTEATKEFDTKDNNKWNHSLLLADIPIVDEGGIKYREFLLDINQSQGKTGKELLSLDELQFFISGDPSLTGYNDVTNDFDGNTGLAQMVWEMDTYLGDRSGLAGADDWILLENCKTPGTCGSGDYDMRALIPSDVFGTDDSVNVTLFNRFGDNQGKTGANAGFEEWAVRVAAGGFVPPGGVPEPGLLSLMAMGMIGIVTVRRKSKI